MSQQHVEIESEALAPQGSYWPIVLAVLLTVGMIGIMVNVVLAYIAGALSIVAMIAWGIERFHGPEAVEGIEEPRVPRPPAAAPAPVPAPVPRPAPFWGLVWFIGTEATIFAFLIASYVYLRATSLTWPPAGTPPASLAYPSVNTVILLASSIPAYFAERAVIRNNVRGMRIGLIVAAIMGAIFLGGQAYEYATLGLTLSTNIFSAGFFTLTGLHGAHVIVGISLLVIMTVLSFRRHYSSDNSFAIQFTGTYWHFVDVVWIFLFTLLYLVR